MHIINHHRCIHFGRCVVISLIVSLSACSQNNEPTSPATTATTETLESTRSPNVLYIMADDLGFSDIAPFGSEINTPTLQQLAAEGTVFTNYHTAVKCNPTRAMFHTGMDNNLGATGPRTNFQIAPNTATLPEILVDAGVHAYISGKWDNGSDKGEFPFDRGYERSFTMLGGAGTHYVPLGGVDPESGVSAYTADGEYTDLPADFYSTITYTDKLISFIESNRDSGQPFFAFAAYTAPHYPMQAPQEYIDRYSGVYDVGYQKIMEERLARIAELNLFGDKLNPWQDPDLRDWDSLSDEDKAIEARRMEVYAGMIELLDEQIARLLAYLDEIGELDNSLVIFSSDNGADGTANGAGYDPELYDNSLENIGTHSSFITLGSDWARVASSPLRLIKTYTSEGGTRVPFIARWPGHIPAGEINSEWFQVMDILPTVLDVMGIDVPEGQFAGREILPIQGRSALPLLSMAQPIYGEQDLVYHTYVEPRLGGAYVKQGDWKLVWWKNEREYGDLQLFNLAEDPSETTDLAAEHPQRVEALWQSWLAYAERSGINLQDSAPESALQR